MSLRTPPPQASHLRTISSATRKSKDHTMHCDRANGAGEIVPPLSVVWDSSLARNVDKGESCSSINPMTHHRISGLMNGSQSATS